METLTGNRTDLQKNTLAIVLAGGRGTRLGPLTNKRVKPAVHFGGKYRIVDFALSNCLNSGIRRIAVVTQYKAHSLLRHLQRGWGFLRGEFNEFIDIWPAQQRVDASWYHGTADAVFQNLELIFAEGFLFESVEREHAAHTAGRAKRYRQGRTECGELGRIV